MSSSTSATTTSFAVERQLALSAVLKASFLASKVQAAIVQTQSGATKADKSPVTVADYASQALISALLAAHLPADQIVGEEDSADLLQPSQDAIRQQIVDLATEAVASDVGEDAEDSSWDKVKSAGAWTEKKWLDAIDRGNSAGGREGRHWALDPIDGTKGFLRGGQYAVCLGLLVDGEVVVGCMGCPNLPVDPKNPEGEKGVLFVAVKGQGAFQRSMSSPALTAITMSPLTPSTLPDASFCESVESGHSDQTTNALIAKHLGITKPSVRMDSQAKYCSIARGGGDVYLRLPVSETYEEKIWDHAAGALLVHEAGGRVSDMHGLPLDFGRGRTLKGNKGVVAAHKDVHALVIQAVEKAVKGE